MARPARRSAEPDAGRVRIVVRVQPGARGRGLVGWLADGSLKVKVAEPPEDGRANRAVCELLAAVLGVKPGAVAVVRGASARLKSIEVTGLTAGEAQRRLARAVAAATGDEDGGERIHDQ
jgi:uncharacterized protein YggU (UPF0235/DUF167 family)